jgi:hypothetical protein
MNLRLDPMEQLLETLNAKLHQWKPETADQVRERVAEIIGLADQDALDLLRSRTREQEVLDILDAPASR